MRGSRHKLSRALVAHTALAAAMIGVVGGATCNFGPLDLLSLRASPAIIPGAVSAESFSMSFTVDLRAYPDAARVSWDFGDGGFTNTMPVATGRSVQHTFPKAGVFTVQVHLFDSGDPVNGRAAGMLAAGSLPVTVVGPNTPPSASFQILDVRDANNNVNPVLKRFVGSSSRDPDGTIASYAWDFGDGSTDSGDSVQHEFPGSGEYIIRLTVTDNRGATNDTTRRISVNTAPTASFTFSFTGLGMQSVEFNAAGSFDPDGIVSYAWDFGDGMTGSGVNIIHPYGSLGDFTVMLTVTDTLGGTMSTTQMIHVSGDTIQINSVTPNFAVEGTTNITLRVTGENFNPNDIIVRVAQATTASRKSATSVTVINPRELTAVFDLSGLPTGDYDIVVATRGVQNNRLENSFRIGTANRVRLKTSLGDIVVEMVSDAPITTANFLQYVTDGFYDGTIFHRVVPAFVVQGGGFLPGNVPQTGERPAIQNEFSPNRSNIRGTVAMAKVANDPNSATSEFFFNLADNSGNLDNQNGGFTVFARVVTGQDVVDAIAAVPLNGEMPVTDVLINEARRE